MLLAGVAVVTKAHSDPRLVPRRINNAAAVRSHPCPAAASFLLRTDFGWGFSFGQDNLTA
jgi:hypothetical protein